MTFSPKSPTYVVSLAAYHFVRVKSLRFEFRILPFPRGFILYSPRYWLALSLMRGGAAAHNTGFARDFRYTYYLCSHSRNMRHWHEQVSNFIWAAHHEFARYDTLSYRQHSAAPFYAYYANHRIVDDAAGAAWRKVVGFGASNIASFTIAHDYRL